MNISKNKKSMAVSIVIVLAMTLTMLLASSAKSFATSDTGFHFRVLPRQENGQEVTGRRRGDVSPSNQWWVKLTHSGEGKGALTDFWLEAKDGTNVSSSMRVRCGAGWYGKGAYASASNRKVFLTAEDNNYKVTGYTVSGRWQQQD